MLVAMVSRLQRSSLQFKYVFEFCIAISVADIACLCPKLGQMSDARVADDGDDAVAFTELFCESSSSDT